MWALQNIVFFLPLFGVSAVNYVLVPDEYGHGVIASYNYPFTYRPENHTYTIYHSEPGDVCFTFHKFELGDDDIYHIDKDQLVLHSDVNSYAYNYRGDAETPESVPEKFKNVWGDPFCFPLNDQPPYKFRLEFLVRNKQKPSDPFGFYAEYDVVNKTQEERNFTAGVSCSSIESRCFGSGACISYNWACGPRAYSGGTLDPKCTDGSDFTFAQMRCVHCDKYRQNQDWDMENPSVAAALALDSHGLSSNWVYQRRSDMPYYQVLRSDHTGLFRAGCCGGVLRVNNLDSYSNLRVPLPMGPLEVYGDISMKPHCLSFWYYMRGTSVQTLVVTGSYRDIGLTTLWLREGDQGDQWRQGQILILNPSKLFWIKITAKRTDDGDDYDIALDDITWTPDVCLPGDDIPTMPGASVTPFWDWTGGSAQMTETTRSWAQNNLDNGKLYMVESPDGSLTLTSAIGMVAGNASCLSFWYDTKGGEMEVEVLVQAQPSGEKTHAQQQRLYTAADYWRRARLDIPAQEGPFQIHVSKAAGNTDYLAVESPILVYSPCGSMQSCLPTEFPCGGSQDGCVPKEMKCNGRNDCENGRDESASSGCIDVVAIVVGVLVPAVVIILLVAVGILCWKKKKTSPQFK